MRPVGPPQSEIATLLRGRTVDIVSLPIGVLVSAILWQAGGSVLAVVTAVSAGSGVLAAVVLSSAALFRIAQRRVSEDAITVKVAGGGVKIEVGNAVSGSGRATRDLDSSGKVKSRMTRASVLREVLNLRRFDFDELDSDASWNGGRLLRIRTGVRREDLRALGIVRAIRDDGSTAVLETSSDHSGGGTSGGDRGAAVPS